MVVKIIFPLLTEIKMSWLRGLSAGVFCISPVFSNVRSVLSQCNTRLRLLHLLHDIGIMWRKTLKHAFSMFYTRIKHGVFDQSERAQGPIYIMNENKLYIISLRYGIYLGAKSKAKLPVSQ